MTKNPQAIVRFPSRIERDFNTTLRKRVDAYFSETGKDQHFDYRMVIKTIVLIAMYVAPFIFILTGTSSAMLFYISWTIMGIGLAGIGMSVMHDANHGAYTRSPIANKIIGYSLNLLGGSVVNWNYQHNILHHTYTNVSGKDKDIENKAMLKFSPHGDHKKVHKHQWFYAFFFYSILTLYWAVAKDYVQFIQFKNEGVDTETERRRTWRLVRIIVLKVVYFALFIGLPLYAGYSWGQVLGGWLIMHLIGGTILSVVFQLAHVVESTEFPLPDDQGSMEHSWLVHQLYTTANFSRSNKLLSWYVGGLNYQIEHHLFPNMCHVHYAEIAPIVKETALEFGYPYNEFTTFGEAFQSHVTMLKKFGSPDLNEIAAG